MIKTFLIIIFLSGVSAQTQPEPAPEPEARAGAWGPKIRSCKLTLSLGGRTLRTGA